MTVKFEYSCDICGFKTTEQKLHSARVSVAGTQADFHVCQTCWVESPKGVFQKIFNQLYRAISGK